MVKTFIFDIDGTICPTCNGDYKNLKPYKEAIKIINQLYTEGNKIIFYTARFMGRNDNNIIESYKQGYDFTLKQLKNWGFKFHELYMGKPNGDILVDDKSIFFKKSWLGECSKRKLKIAVVSPNIESFGGVTQCAISCIEALNSIGIIPDVFSVTGNQEVVNKKHNKKLKYNFKRLKIPKRMALYSMIIKNFIMYFKDYHYSFDFTNSIPFNKKNYFSYINFPEFIGERRGKYNRGFWRIYYFPKRFLNIFIRKLIQKSQIDFAGNSKFTVKSTYENSKKKIKVIYPPCNLNEFKSPTKKQKQIISVAGFSTEKNQEMQIKLASKLPMIKFEICGSATRNPFYFKKIKSLSKNIKNIHLNPNEPFNNIRKKLADSLIFLHTSENEPFGISSVEAIAAGCIPIVHNSGGQKEIVPFEELRFNNLDEAVKKIKKILNMKPKELNRYRTKLQEHIKQFDKELFKKNILKFIEKNEINK